MAKALLFVRNYSSKSTAKMVKPPIAVFGVEGRYTNALYSAASKNNKLDVVESDLKKINQALENDVKFRDVVMNPLLNQPQKKQLINEVFGKKMNVNELTANLLTVMAENGRLKYVPAVAKMFSKVMSATRGEVDVLVTTAKAITDENQKKELENSLKAFTKKKLNIQLAVDPSLIGGLVVDFGGEHYIDMSIRSKVKMYSDLIKLPV